MNLKNYIMCVFYGILKKGNLFEGSLNFLFFKIKLYNIFFDFVKKCIDFI